MADKGERAVWLRPLAEIWAQVASSPAGLSDAEAGRRLAVSGPNRFDGRTVLPVWRKILKGLGNPLVLVLLAAAAVSAATGDLASFAIISVMILIGIVLDAVQENRAERAAESLRGAVALRERVWRDGTPQERPAETLVMGDVIEVSAGDLVPADGRLIAATALFVNESALTGEAYPVAKAVRDDLTGEDLSGAENMVFMGASVVSGSGRFVATATGRQTELGRIAHDLRRPAPPAALERGTYEFGLLIVRLTLFLALFVLLASLVAQRPFLDSFIFAMALAVGLTPELLPMVVSVTLARGAMRMAKRRVIVKRLGSIHDLGNMDVLCTDKTGTLTEARIELALSVDLSGAPAPEVLALAALNSRFETGLKSPLDDAILTARPVAGDAWRLIDELPFDFERRRVSVLVAQGDRRVLVTKGAPEDVLAVADRVAVGLDDPPRPLTEADRAQALALFEALGAKGHPVLAVAFKPLGPETARIAEVGESGLVLSGYLGFLDPPKSSAGAAINALAGLGVAVKIVSGDNERVTRNLCETLGIPVTGILLGHEVLALDDPALAAAVDGANLICRATPAAKSRVIHALRARGHVVGFMGDGINDAPSIHAADVGISVDGAVDVAKDAADMILLDQDLGVVADGVAEGRRTFANIMKYVMMGTSSNFGNMLSMAGAALFLPFLPMLPIQVLLNNLLYDLSEVPIPLDEVDASEINHPGHWDMGFIRDFMVTLGPISSLFDFLTFGILYWVFEARDALFQTGWFVESLMTQVLVIFIIRTRGAPWRSRPHAVLATTSIGIVLIGILIPYTPVGAWFKMTPLPIAFLATTLAMTLCYLALAEMIKRWFYRRRARIAPPPQLTPPQAPPPQAPPPQTKVASASGV